MVSKFKPLAMVLALLLVGSVTMKLRSVSASIHYEAMTADERYYLPPAAWLRVLSLGYNEAAADLVWIKTVVYFGGRLMEGNDDAGGNYTVNYLKTAVELDPHMRTLYTTGSSLTLFQNSGVVSEATVKMSIELLELGTRVFPNDGEIHFTLGFNHYYEMRPFMSMDSEDAKRKYHNEVGTRYIGLSSMMENAPSYAALLATSLISKQGIDDITIEHLRSMLFKETDPKVRGTLKWRLEQELGKAAKRDIAASENLIAKWKAEFPFVPYDFYLFLQPVSSAKELINPLYQSNRILGLDEIPDVAFKTDPVDEELNE